MKMLTKEIVKITAENMLIEHGCMTSLEVKKRLREQNYFAIQADVSAYLDQLAREEGWSYTDNGKFRIYQFETNLNKLLLGLSFSVN